MTKSVSLSRFLFFLSAVCLLLFPHEARAEFECVADVSFRIIPSEKGPETNAGKEEARSSSEGAKGREIFFSTITSRGTDEEAGKAELKRKSDVTKEKAFAQCKATYENKATCIATKYSTMEAVLNSLDFKARDELQKAIRIDCEKQTGICMEAHASEAQCKEIVASAPAEAAEGGDAAKGAEAGKDAKGGAAKKEEKKK